MGLNYKKKLLLANNKDTNILYNGLKFTALEDNVQFTFSNSEVIKYMDSSGIWSSVNNESTDNLTLFPTVPLNTGESIFICGNFLKASSSTINGTFSSTGIFDVSGNIMSLIGQYDDPNSNTFENNISLSEFGYVFKYLFNNCTNLIHADKLLLPAETLATYCYQYMFFGCSSLVSAPELPATTLVSNCYERMFQNCTSLVSVPELPATTLANNCYRYMFMGCSSLVSAPELPAMNLVTYCYAYMFYNCTSLTIAPTLPAATPKNYCYNNMFYGCSNLSYIKMMLTSSATGSLTNWVNGVADEGTFVMASKGNKNINSAGWWDGATYSSSLVPKDSTHKWEVLTENNPLSIDNKGTSNITVGFDNNLLKSLKYAKINTSQITNNNILDLSTITFIDYSTDIVLEPNKSIIFIGEANTDIDVYNEPIGSFNIQNINNIINNNVHVSGSILSLIYGEEHNNFNKFLKYYLFKDLFRNSIITDASKLILSVYDLTNNDCYNGMFMDCTSLTTTPVLPAQVLSDRCYANMFMGCTSLVTAPELPAENLATECFANMFRDCTSLSTIPLIYAKIYKESSCNSMFYGCSNLTDVQITGYIGAMSLGTYCFANMFHDCSNLKSIEFDSLSNPNTTLAEGCCASMFNGCSSLVSAPELPATVLADRCYQYMFSDCSSLVSAPELPATTLATNCYEHMFQNCTSLVSAPELPATVLADQCYQYMFSGCSSLVSAPELPAIDLIYTSPIKYDGDYQGYYNCYEGMFSNCSKLTSMNGNTNIILPAIKLSSGCYKNMFMNCTSITSIEILASTPKTNIYNGSQRYANNCYAGMLYGCSSLSNIKLHDTDIWGGLIPGTTDSYYYDDIEANLNSRYFMGYSASDWWCTGVNNEGSFYKKSNSKLGYLSWQMGGGGYFIGAIPKDDPVDPNDGDWRWVVNYF